MKSFIKKGARFFAAKFIPYNLKYKPLSINYGKEGVTYTEVYPAFQSSLTFSNDLLNACADYIMIPKVVDVPPAYVVEIEQGRIYATLSDIAIIDSANRLIPEVSYHYVSINKLGNPADNRIFKDKFFIEPVKCKGTLFTLLSGGGAASNYGHWLIDAIPRLGLLKQSGLFESVDWFLVPNYNYDYHHDSLSLLGIPAEKIITAKTVNHIEADKIIASTTTRHIGHLPSWAAQFLRDAYSKSIKPEKFPPLAYIRRSDSAIRRILNEDELVAAIKSYGFIDYELSKLSFSQKVNLFRSADMIVSATSAGLSNLVFCRPGTKALEIFHSTFISTMFADIASKVDVDYHYLIKYAGKKAKTIKEGEVGHFSVDVAQVKSKIEDILEKWGNS